MKESSKSVPESERDLFFEHSLDLLAVAGTDGYFKRVNPAFGRVLGYSEAELFSRPMVSFMHPDDVEKTKRGISILATGSARVSSVNRYCCKDGTYRWFSWNTTPVGDTLYTAGRDITEQVRAEERIRELNEELARRNVDLEHIVAERVAELQKTEAQVQQLQKMDAVGRLAGGVAHDFNNMLGAITMYCDLLAEDVGDTNLVRDHVRDIKVAAERGAALTRQLLIFSRKQIVQTQDVELNPLIERLRKMLVRLIGERNRIDTRLAADLRGIRADPSQMEQVLLNLVVNARDAMPDGGTVTIETANVYLDEAFSNNHLAVQPGPYVLLSVSDSGCGMDAETLSKIFEPFFTTKPVGQGTGLGLTTTYGIVKQNQGTIWVYSEPGQGTVFKVYLPVTDSVVSPEPAVEAARFADSTEVRTILLVEDDERLREGFTKMLRKKGYEVLVAEGGEEALRFLKDHSGVIHLLLTDVVMPGLNGFEIASEAKRMRNDLQVLYMSGYTSDSLERNATAIEEEINYIQKPFSASALTAKIEEVFTNSRLPAR